MKDYRLQSSSALCSVMGKLIVASLSSEEERSSNVNLGAAVLMPADDKAEEETVAVAGSGAAGGECTVAKPGTV